MNIIINLRHINMWGKDLRDPALTAFLALQILMIFVFAPLQANNYEIPLLAPLAMVLAGVSLVILASTARGAVTIASLTFVSGIGGGILRDKYPSMVTEIIGTSGEILALMALTWVVGMAVFAPGRISSHRVRGAIVLYLNLAMTFAAVYRLLITQDPDAFSGFPPFTHGPLYSCDVLYFSFTTITSTGFGDIVPVHPLARSMVNLEAIVGQLYPATVLARIVTLHLQGHR